MRNKLRESDGRWGNGISLESGTRRGKISNSAVSLTFSFPSGNKTTVYNLPLQSCAQISLLPSERILMRSILTEEKRKDKVSLVPRTKIDFPKDFRAIIGAHYGGVSLDLLFRQPFLMLRLLWHRLFESRGGIFLKSIKRFCGARCERKWSTRKNLGRTSCDIFIRESTWKTWRLLESTQFWTEKFPTKNRWPRNFSATELGLPSVDFSTSPPTPLSFEIRWLHLIANFTV